MFCPQCGKTQSDELKFCKTCGANLDVVRMALATREKGEKFDWNKTWVAEMLLSGEEGAKRLAEIERLQGLTPEVKRYNEIKAGVITSCAGIAITIFLSVLMEGIVLGGSSPPGDAAILTRVWVAGLIPFFVGIALIINGVFVSKKLVEIANRSQSGPDVLEDPGAPRAMRSAETNQFIPRDFSVTDATTKHLTSQVLLKKPVPESKYAVEDDSGIDVS